MNEKKMLLSKPVIVAVIAVLFGFLAGNVFPVFGENTIFRNRGLNRVVNQGTNYGLNQRDRVNRVGTDDNRMMNRTGNVDGTMGRFGGPISGEVVSSDATSVTIKTADGTLKKITISDTTKVYKNNEVGVSGLVAGAKVTIMGMGLGNGTTGVESIIIDWPGMGNTVQN